MVDERIFQDLLTFNLSFRICTILPVATILSPSRAESARKHYNPIPFENEKLLNYLWKLSGV